MRVLLAAAAAAASCNAVRMPGRRMQLQPAGQPSTVNCTWRTFEQKVDHFGDAPGTFKQRYCLYQKYWTGAADVGFSAEQGAKGPIFFYTGNESPVEEYINNTGLMWQVGERMGALLVFAEHRFEPQTHPSLEGTQQCYGYCTTAQALADYVSLIAAVKLEFLAESAPVVAFGGSYGGMLAGWMRMKYPNVIAGSIAGSAPIWGLASTLTQDSLDRSAQAVSRGASKAGGATDMCFSNIRAAWPLIQQVGKTSAGLKLLAGAARSCSGRLTSAAAFTNWAQSPWFELAEGDYPFASTYITYSVGPGYLPLPPWPIRVACAKGLNDDHGVRLNGSVADVKYTLTMGDIKVDIDWDSAKGNGAELTEQQIKSSGVLDLARSLTDAVGVWYNVSGKETCYKLDEAQAEEPPLQAAREEEDAGDAPCPACPPCDDCPPCPVSRCSHSSKTCHYSKPLSKTFSWGGVVCNEDLYLHNNAVQGVGRDFFWPPSQPRGYTVDSVVGSHSLKPGCAFGMDAEGLYGSPKTADSWSTWLNAYYGGSNITAHRNIVWSNGALDPWSGAGVYPEGGGPTGPLRQNITADGSQVALVIDLGGHHLDLFFSTPEDPPSVKQVRAIEESMIRDWCQEYYSA